jgi:hypothetical protein
MLISFCLDIHIIYRVIEVGRRNFNDLTAPVVNGPAVSE